MRARVFHAMGKSTARGRAPGRLVSVDPADVDVWKRSHGGILLVKLLFHALLDAMERVAGNNNTLSGVEPPDQSNHSKQSNQSRPWTRAWRQELK